VHKTHASDSLRAAFFNKKALGLIKPSALRFNI